MGQEAGVREYVSELGINQNLREKLKLSLPKANSSKYGLNTFRCYGPNIWNSLHDDLRNAPTIKILCRAFETWLSIPVIVIYSVCSIESKNF